MEPQEGAPAEGAGDSLFSDQIRLWLDEGDRLDEKAAATSAAVPAAVEGRLRRIVRRLRPGLDRYRVVVLAGLGLIPFFLFALTQHGPPAPALAVSSVSNIPAPPPAPPPLPEAAAAPAPAAPRSVGPAVSPHPGVPLKRRHRASHRSKHRPVAARAR